MKVVRAISCSALALCWLLAAVYGQNTGPYDANTTASQGAIASSTKPSACSAADQCCQYSASVADCTSTESTSKGCRSHVTCTARADPCSSATNRSSCLAAGNFCRFNNALSTCALDASLHPCTAITDMDQCAATSSCTVAHECKDTCAPCLKCLEATKTFAQLPVILRTLSASGGDHGQFFKGFCLSTVMGIDPSMQSQILLGCDQIVADTAKSSGLLQRPGALCSRLGMCQTGCSASNPNTPVMIDISSGGNVTTVITPPTVSLCSATGSSADDAETAAAGVAAAMPNSLGSQTWTMANQFGLNPNMLGNPMMTNPMISNLLGGVGVSNEPSNSYCVTSADCAGGLACDTFTQPRCHASCDPETGLDKCIAAGICVDFCERPDIKMAVEDSKRRFRTCANSTDCGAGQQCGVPDFPCKIATCSNAAAAANGGDPLQVMDCPAICLYEKPRMISAKFSDDGHSIQVILNQEAAPVEALCAYIFDEQTSGLLGAFSRCTTRGNTLTIWLAGDVRIRPGQHGLTISKRNGLLASVMGVNSQSGAPVFAGGLENGTMVHSCGNCSGSAVPVKLTGPSQVALPCDDSTYGDTAASFNDLNPVFRWVVPPFNPNGFSFAALVPSEAMWMINNIQWAVLEPSNVTSLEKIANATNSKAYTWDRQGLSIPVEALPTIPEGQITLAVNITNIFDVTSTSQFTFTKHNSSKTPALELDKTLTQFYPSQGFRIVARRLLNDCKMSALGSEVLQWSTDMPNVSLDGVQSNRLVFTPNELLGNVEVGKDYNITLKAYYSGSDSMSTDTITLRAVGSPLAVQISGPSGSVPTLQGNLTFDATASRDPDDPADAVTQMTYLWSCQNNLDMSPCFGMQQGSKWVLDPAQLPANQSHTITLTIAKGSRNATTSTTIIPMVNPTPSGQIRRFCGLQQPSSSSPIFKLSITGRDPAATADLDSPFPDFDLDPAAAGLFQTPDLYPTAKPCPAKHNPTDPLTLVLTADAPYSDAFLTWWFDGASAPGVRLSERNTAAGVHGNTITILPGGLPSGGSITVHVNMSIPAEDPEAEPLVGTSSITIPLNGPPYCSSAPLSNCAILNTTEGTFPTARFKAWASGWADPDQDALTYEFGTISDEFGPQPLASGPSNTYTFSYLLPGDSTVYVCAIDSFGARACERSVVSVTRPKRAWDADALEDKILNIDFDLGGRAPGDAVQDIVPTNVVDAALQMASLLAYSVTDMVNSVGGFLGFLQDGSGHSTTVPALAYKPSVQNATNKVLVALSKTGQAVNDTVELDSLLTAGSKLGKATKTNPRGGRALLNLFRHTMRANNKEQKSLSPQQSNTYTDAFTVGLSAAVAPTSAAKPSHNKKAPKTLAAATPAAPAAAKANSAAKRDSTAAYTPDSPTHGGRQLLVTPTAIQASLDFGDGPAPKSIKFQSPFNTFTYTQAYKYLLDGVRRLGSAQEVILGAPAAAVGNAGVCVAPALLQQRDVGGYRINFGCPGIPAPAEVALPESFPGSCSNDTACSRSTNIFISSQYFSQEGSMAPIILGVVDKAGNMIKRDRSIDTIVVSGVLNITLNYTTPAGTFCPMLKSKTSPADKPSTRKQLESGGNSTAAGSTSSSSTPSAPCRAKLRFPIDAKLFDASKTLECILLAPKGYGNKGLEAAAAYPVTNISKAAAVMQTAAVKMLYGGMAIRGAATASVPGPAAAAAPGSNSVIFAECSVPKQGLYVVVQWPAGSDSEVPNLASDLVPGAFTDEPVRGSAKPRDNGQIGDNVTNQQGEDPDQDESPVTAQNPLQPYQPEAESAIKYTYTFNLDFKSLTADAETLDNFRSLLQKTFLTGLSGIWTDGPSLADTNGALKLNYVTVSNIRPSAVLGSGSSGGYTVADVYLTPPDGTTKVQIDQLVQLAPSELISTNSKLQALLLTAELVTTDYNPKSRRTTLSGTVIAGITAGCAVSAVAGIALALSVTRKYHKRGTSSSHSSRRTTDAGNSDGGLSGDETPVEDISRSRAVSQQGSKLTTGKSSPFSPQNMRENPLHDYAKMGVPDQTVHHNYMFYCSDELMTGSTIRDASFTRPSRAFDGSVMVGTAPMSPHTMLNTRSTVSASGWTESDASEITEPEDAAAAAVNEPVAQSPEQPGLRQPAAL